MSQISLPLPGATHAEPRELRFFTAVVPPLENEFLYSYAPSEHPEISVGDVVEVQLGRRQTYAYVTSVQSPKEETCRMEMEARGVTIKKISDKASVTHAFGAEHLSFYEWIARYYAEPLSKILDLAIPTPAPEKRAKTYSLAEHDSKDFEAVRAGSSQEKVIDYLRKDSSPVESKKLQDACGTSAAVIRTLVKKGLILESTASAEKAACVRMNTESFADIPLNSEQAAAVGSIQGAIDSRSFAATLLQGVTGSGKTEVYLALIIETLKRGRSALVIVPEIALTPQLTERFVARLQQPVAVLHSSLKPKERWRHWTTLASGDVKIAIGARSALFAPLRDLGIIIVDEEHDSSFKQGEGIRYHARDLALVRGKLCNAPVVLGSATPSLESYHNAVSGKYTHLFLTKRYHDSANSSFEVIDLNTIKPWEMKSKSISPKFYTCLNQALEAGGQAFILYNKRGFASYLQCSSCEHVLGCPHCSVTLTFHRNTNTLLCHQCNFSMVPPIVCSACGAHEAIDTESEPLFAHRGSGTERVHEEISALFPKARVAILDRDTVSTMADYVEILGKVRAREVDILVGTQMIAKGHDLPGVTFVGIVDCDVGLHIPDFRAAERAFQLLTQVAGRAGRRSERGTVVLQTRVPSHAALTMTATSNYKDFAEQELELRQSLGYPPFRRILRIVVSSTDKHAALSRATVLAQTAKELIGARDLALLGPAPAPIEKVRGQWRYHTIIKSASTAELQHVMKHIKRYHPSSSEVRVSYDLDPHDML